MINSSPPSRPELMRLPSGHYRLDATRLSLQELAPLLRCLHEGCEQCRVVFSTPTGTQAFSVAAPTTRNARDSCSLVHCRNGRG